jgi:hypothetical protein
MTPISPDQYETVCFTCGACVGKPWVGLTDDEAHKIIDDCTSDEAELEELIGFSIAILVVEAKLKEKNNG